LSQSSRFQATFSFLDQSDENVVIRINRGGEARFRVDQHGTPIIEWNPQRAQMTLEGGSQSPALRLAHEMEHARNRLEGNGQGNMVLTDPKLQFTWDTVEEYNVITGAEMQIALELHEPTRSAHRVVGTYPVAGPAVTWPTDFQRYEDLVNQLVKINGWDGKKPPR
jgi:hypothetical protein